MVTFGFSSGGASTYIGGAVPLVATGLVIGDPIWTIGRLFTRYKVRRFCVDFTPRVGTITNASFVMSYTPDPNWAQDHSVPSIGVGGYQRYGPTEYVISQTDNAVQLPVWAPAACLDCTNMLPKQDLFVSTEDAFGFQTAELGIGNASLRQNTNFGTILVSGSENPFSVIAGVGTFGDLYIEYDFEFWDMGNPQNVVNPFGSSGALASSSVSTQISTETGSTVRDLGLELKRREISPAPVLPRR